MIQWMDKIYLFVVGGIMFYEFKHPMRADYFRVETGYNFNFPAHMHHCFEFVTVTAGCMTVSIDSREYILTKGRSVLIFPNQIHSLHTAFESCHTLCLFSPNLVSAFANSVKGKLPCDNSFESDNYLIDKLAVISENDVFSIKGVLYLIVASFCSNAEFITSQDAPIPLLYHIFRFVEENYRGECSLSDLARDIGYEYAYLSKYFKKTVGMGYNVYVNTYRINHACYLLTNTEKSVLEVSGECGFNSLRSFNRNFRDLIGHTPVQYRLNNTLRQ